MATRRGVSFPPRVATKGVLQCSRRRRKGQGLGKGGSHRVLKALACVLLAIASLVLGVCASAWLIVTLAIHGGVTGATITAVKLILFGPAGLTGRVVLFVVVALALAVGIYLGVYKLAHAVAALVAKRRRGK